LPPTFGAGDAGGPKNSGRDNHDVRADLPPRADRRSGALTPSTTRATLAALVQTPEAHLAMEIPPSAIHPVAQRTYDADVSGSQNRQR
jgi:hypothetical protein